MYKTTVKIDGMACSMCESHVNDSIRTKLNVRKVTSSHKKNIAEIISEEPIDADTLHSVLDPTGYRVLDVQCEPYIKKGLFSR